MNSAVYLMLLRLLHRNYHDCFRLADSIATDAPLNKDGSLLFSYLSEANDDFLLNYVLKTKNVAGLDSPTTSV